MRPPDRSAMACLGAPGTLHDTYTLWKQISFYFFCFHYPYLNLMLWIYSRDIKSFLYKLRPSDTNRSHFSPRVRNFLNCSDVIGSILTLQNIPIKNGALLILWGFKIPAGKCSTGVIPFIQGQPFYSSDILFDILHDFRYITKVLVHTSFE